MNPSLPHIKAVLFGVAVGDALGVPVEFKSRVEISKNPVTDMRGYGTYNQPPGTWSDDSSLTFCLADALTRKYNLNTIGKYLADWYFELIWTPHGEVFDIGGATREALFKINMGEDPEHAGGTSERSNGNGSLMRISPLLFYLLDKSMDERFKITKQNSSMTHGHIRSIIGCFYYLEFMKLILDGKDKFQAYATLKKELPTFLASKNINASEIALYDRLLQADIQDLPESGIRGSGYVLHCLEASIWCLLTTDSYKDAVLKAVNLGEDTDTTGAVTGGIAGLYYGFDHIPEDWVKVMARRKDIEDLAKRLSDRLPNIS